jgi:cytochrome c2
MFSLSLFSCDDETESDNSDKTTRMVSPDTIRYSPKEIAVQKGHELFKHNCAVCHSMSTSYLVGPGLQGVIKRVPNPSDEWLLKYIKNNEAVLKSGDAYANKLLSDNGNKSMTVFEGILSDDQIKDIIAFLANPPIEVTEPTPDIESCNDQSDIYGNSR